MYVGNISFQTSENDLRELFSDVGNVGDCAEFYDLAAGRRQHDHAAPLGRGAACLYVDFVRLFDPSEGRMGVTVTFLAILELLRESLISVVQTDAYGPIHVRVAQGNAGREISETN